MNELTISVKIADRPYRLTIKKDEEEIIRKAAKRINEKVKEFGENYAYNDKQDLLSMVAILFATKAISLEDQVKGKDDQLVKKLSEIEKVLSERIK